MKIGSHVANNGTEMLIGSVKEALSYNANSFMLYLGAPQNSFRKPISEFNIPQYMEILKNNNIDPQNVVIHAPYIINLAQPDEEKRQFAIDFITSEVIKTAAIGSKYIVIHPGAHMKDGTELGLGRIAESLKSIIKNTSDVDVVLLLETMAGKGTECCKNFEEIKTLLELVDSQRVQVCFDTCHTFDSGYDLVNNYDEVFNNFDKLIGLDRIRVIHVNDSKNDVGSHKDRHENIGFGNIGFKTLSKICHDERFSNVIKILETPYIENMEGEKTYPPYKEEIEMIRKNTFDPMMKEKIKLKMEMK